MPLILETQVSFSCGIVKIHNLAVQSDMYFLLINSRVDIYLFTWALFNAVQTDKFLTEERLRFKETRMLNRSTVRTYSLPPIYRTFYRYE